MTCSEPTIETLEKGVKYVHILQKRHQNGANDAVLMFLLTLNVFTPLSLVDFEMVYI